MRACVTARAASVTATSRDAGLVHANAEVGFETAIQIFFTAGQRFAPAPRSRRKTANLTFGGSVAMVRPRVDDFAQRRRRSLFSLGFEVRARQPSRAEERVGA